MKASDKKDLHTKTDSELKKLIKDAKSALFNLLLDKEQNKLKNTRDLFLKRKEIAVIKTIIREKKEVKSNG
jgi:ribosomal protein L29